MRLARSALSDYVPCTNLDSDLSITESDLKGLQSEVKLKELEVLEQITNTLKK